MAALLPTTIQLGICWASGMECQNSGTSIVASVQLSAASYQPH